jgi:DNA-binding MarR family transcriptional regulator
MASSIRPHARRAGKPATSPAPGAEPATSPAPGAEPAAARFAAAFETFLLALRRSQARGQQSPDGLTLAQYYLLHPLERGQPVALCQLAESAGIAAPTATRLVDGLERAGVVMRERSILDRRSVLVSLTPAGRERLQAKHRELAARRQMLYESLEPDERAVSERLLRHLAEVMDHLGDVTPPR